LHISIIFRTFVTELNIKDMKEELTSLMHLEFCKDEQEAMDLRVMSVAAVKARGGDVEAALKDVGLTRDEYNNNLAFVFNFSKQEEKNHAHPYYLAR
jgi:hypothetical protein